MKDKLTHFQEQFCREYIKTGNASEAYRTVSPKAKNWLDATVWERASVMMRRNKVATRIAELQEHAALRAQETVDSLGVELNEMLDGARELKRYDIGVAAIMGKAKLFGFLVDKKEIRTGALDMIGAKDLRAIDDAISEFSVRAKARESQPEGAGGTTH